MIYLLALSMLLFTLASGWAVHKGGTQSNLSISQHVALSRNAKVVFGSVTIPATIIFASALVGVVLPLYDANLVSHFVFGLIAVDLLIVALIPHIAGTWQGPVHNVAAWSMIYLILAAMVCMLFWPLSTVARLIAIISLVFNGALLLTALLKRKKFNQIFLYIQTIFLTVFMITLCVVGFI